MATSRDSPNPLRPYYIPPSIGPPATSIPNGTRTSSSSPQPSFPSRAGGGGGSSRNNSIALSKPSFGAQARDYLSDLDYGEYLSDTNPSVAEMAKRLMDQALWNYTCVLLAQPFEVAKTVLQCHLAASQDQLADVAATPSRPSSYASGKLEDYPSDEEDSEDDSQSYFTSAAPASNSFASPTRTPERVRRTPSRSDSSTPTPSNRAQYKLDLRKTDSLFEVIGQLWQKESAWGLWKGTNATFVYNFLQRTIESWTRSMLSALLNVSDPGATYSSSIGGLDIMDSANPMLSLAVAVAAAGIAGVVLAPLDLVRTRLILTPTTSTPRHILPSIRALPSLSLPSSIMPAALLHSTIPTLFSTSTPLFLRSFFGIDPVLTPATYSLSTFLASTAELFVRLPIETVLRRGQIAVLHEYEHEKQREAYTTLRPQGRQGSKKQEGSMNTVVDVGPYKGVVGTMWFIIREEGVTFVGPAGAAAAVAAHGSRGRNQLGKVRKGQGAYGLWRGWRVGFWGIVGVWGAAALGSSGGEF